MNHAFQHRGCYDLFVFACGAAAALTGLLFVALSLGLERFKASKHAPTRAALGRIAGGALSIGSPTTH